MNIKLLTIALTAMLALAGCKQGPTETSSIPLADPQEAATQQNEQPRPELVPVLRKAQPAKPAAQAKQQATTQTKQQSATKQATPAPYQKGDKLYVETDGAQGRVWGYVTMNGDRGTGTIHDWDENTWAVNVTRHGNELFAVDQNSRLYVFKLKQK